MNKKNIFVLLLTITASLFFISCESDSISQSKLDLQQLGEGNIKPTIWGIRGFNHAGAPIFIHSTNFLYELDEKNNVLNKLGSAIPNAVQVANSRIVQDGKGDYYYLSGRQSEVYILNKSTNQWDTVFIAKGYKNIMVGNQNGDILVVVNNTTMGGKESYYKKMANSNAWTKIGDKPTNIDYSAEPQFLTNNGIAFFNYASSPGSVDGANIYSDIALNTNTGTFEKLFDYSDADNFSVTEGYSYYAFYCDYITPNGVFYVVQNPTSGVVANLYKLTTDKLPAKFTKVQELDLTPLEEDGYLSIRGWKIDEASGTIRIRLSCMKGLYSHKNLGIAKLGGSSAIKILEHDGPQRGLISSPNGKVYVHNWEGYLYKWK